eukprot:g8465.t1
MNKFSRGWWDGYLHSGPAGCQQKEGTLPAYTWEGSDWRGDIDGLVLAWTRAIATGHGDIAVIIAEPESRAPASVCQAEVAAGGSMAAATEPTEIGEWSRFFSPMAHLCVFRSQQEWNEFLGTRGADLPPDASQTTAEGGLTDIPWGQDPEIRSALEGTATDQARAMARILHHLLSHVQPDIQRQVQSVLHKPNNAFLPDTGGKYVGMHVRKKEPRVYGNFKATETLDCFEKSYKYLEDLDIFAAEYIPASKITNVCLVSQDDTALAEAKGLARRYFRNVKSDDVVQVSTDLPSTPDAGDDFEQNCAPPGFVGHVNALVSVLAELQLMAKADVFVGDASEAFARLCSWGRGATMADSWEDEEFDLPSAAPPTTVPVSWEDEEEEEDNTGAVAPGLAPKMSAAKAAKSAAEKDARIAAELETRLQLGETAEQRRLRERNRVEEADNDLTEDLFGGGGARGKGGAAAGLSALALKNMQDHVKLAIELGDRMESSKPAHMAAFLKELVTKLSAKMTADGLTDVTNHTIMFRDEKREAEERIAKAKANKTNVIANQRANKKKSIKKKKAHSDVFGGDFDGDGIDDVGMDYESKYDDFM